MRPLRFVAALLFALVCEADGQWIIEESPTSSDLRGIDNAGGGAAWASGTNGTVLRTIDGGSTWHACAVPAGGEKLDFRGVQAFDLNSAIVMSSGKGDLSRLYKTVDGCRTWKLILTNPEPDGFWDSLRFSAGSGSAHAGRDGVLVGDPVGGLFQIFVTRDGGDTWRQWGAPGSAKAGICNERQAEALKDESLFAASNGSVLEWSARSFLFVTGGTFGARLVYSDAGSGEGAPCSTTFLFLELPLGGARSSAGAFAVAAEDGRSYFPLKLMAVGGDYAKPNQNTGSAVFITSKDGAHPPRSTSLQVRTPEHSPGGYRSAVAYDARHHLWITAGPNGTDVSSDDGKNWRALHPGATEGHDADKNWNALALPFAVGPRGRIGRWSGE